MISTLLFNGENYQQVINIAIAGLIIFVIVILKPVESYIDKRVFIPIVESSISFNRPTHIFRWKHFELR
jgi:hypothetical protein